VQLHRSRSAHLFRNKNSAFEAEFFVVEQVRVVWEPLVMELREWDAFGKEVEMAD
jgi:hypothetical protein